MGGGYKVDDLEINYLLETNGYICLGKQYGNLMIQYGNTTNTNNNGYPFYFNFPIPFVNKPFLVVCNENSSHGWNNDNYAALAACNENSSHGWNNDNYAALAATIVGWDSNHSNNATFEVSTRWIGSGSVQGVSVAYINGNGNNFNFLAIGV